MAELWNASNFKYKEVSGHFDIIAWRATLVQTGDTLTLPVAEIVGHSEQDETTAGVIKVARSSVNVLTITCTNNDNISGIAIVRK